MESVDNSFESITMWHVTEAQQNSDEHICNIVTA